MDALLPLLLTNAAAAGLVALAAWAASRAVRRQAVVHGLWLLALVKLVTPPIAPLPVIPAWSLAPLVPRATPTVVAIAPPADTVGGAAPRVALRPGRGAPPLAPTALPARDWRSGLCLVVALGALSLGLVAAWRFVRFARLLEHARPGPPALAGRVSHLAAGLGLRRAPPLLLVPAPVPPMLWPHPRGARLLLPEGLLAELDPEELDALLAHELAHLRRRDHWVRLVELAATALFWWYPVTWWARGALRRAEERCCDEWVLRVLPGSARAYARGILKSLSLVAGRTGPVPALASGAGPIADIEARLKEILMTRPLPTLPTPMRFAFAAVAVLGLAVFPTPAQTGATPADGLEPAVAAATEKAPAAVTPAPAPRPVVAPAPAPRPVAAPRPAAAPAASPASPRPVLAPAPPEKGSGTAERRAFEDQRRALEEERRKLHQRQLELARQEVELHAKAEQVELRAQADRLRSAGRAEEAARLERQMETTARRMDLQRRQLALESEHMALEAKVEAEELALRSRLEEIEELREVEELHHDGDTETLRREVERAREAREKAVQEALRSRKALQEEMVDAEKKARAVAAEAELEAMQKATQDLARSLEEQMTALREALADAPGRNEDVERELARLKAALDALRSTGTPRR